MSNIENIKSVECEKSGKKTYQAPIMTALKINKKIASLKDSNEIINYLVNDVEENDLKNYILYFLSEAEKEEITEYDRKSCIEFLLKKSEEGKNIYIDKGGNYYYSLGFESENDYSLMFGWNNRRYHEPRVDVLIYKIKGKKGIKESLESIPNIIEEGKKYIKDEKLSQHFNKVINIIKNMLHNGYEIAGYELNKIKKGLEFLKKIEEGESRENIESKIRKEGCDYVLPFLIKYIEKGKTDMFLNCAKMDYDRYKKTYPHNNYLETIGLKENATIVDIANKKREKLLESDRERRSSLKKKYGEKNNKDH